VHVLLTPLFQPLSQLSWFRWRFSLIALAIAAVIALLIQLSRLSRIERDREIREQEQGKQWETVAKYLASHEVSTPAASTPFEAAVNSNLRVEDPRIYPSLERKPFRMGDSIFHAPTSTFLLRNEGDHEALKVQIEPLILFKSRADFDVVECIAAHTQAGVLPKTT